MTKKISLTVTLEPVVVGQVTSVEGYIVDSQIAYIDYIISNLIGENASFKDVDSLLEFHSTLEQLVVHRGFLLRTKEELGRRSGEVRSSLRDINAFLDGVRIKHNEKILKAMADADYHGGLSQIDGFGLN